MDTLYDVFISYAGEDKKIAFAMCDYLEQRNLPCWIAPRNITASDDYGKAIIDGIKHARIMVVILSDSSNESNHVRNEVERAFNNDLRIITFRTKDIILTDSLEYFLSRKQWLDAIDGAAETHFADLLTNCVALLSTQGTIGRTASTRAAPTKVLKTLQIRSKGYFAFADTKLDVLWDGKVVGQGSFKKGFNVTINDVSNEVHTVSVKFNSRFIKDSQCKIDPKSMTSDTIEFMHSSVTGGFSWKYTSKND